MRRIDTAHSTWLFDTERKRFRRVPHGVDPEGPFAGAAWEPYVDLEIGTDGEVTVILDAAGTRRLRSRLREAGEEPTREIELQLD